MAPAANATGRSPRIRIFLCGDVMTGRGIDQIQAQSVDPELRESFVKDARDYVRIAERENGPIPEPVAPDYVWGDASSVWREFAADAHIVNLETSITTSNFFWPSKGIHYRMHPANVAVLEAAGVDVCTLANNHVLDFGYDGLSETLRSLRATDILIAGAGEDIDTAMAPAVLPLAGGRRLLVYGLCHASSGVPGAWSAGHTIAGVYLLGKLGVRNAELVAKHILTERREGDVVIVSIHWGGNWGYGITAAQRDFAHGLIDSGAVDVVHGHSSHHPKGIERYRGRLILYGCGDFLNDYEAIGGHESFRPWLSLMYFVTLEPGEETSIGLDMIPLRVQRLRLVRADEEDTEWLARRLGEASDEFGTRIDRKRDRLTLANERTPVTD